MTSELNKQPRFTCRAWYTSYWERPECGLRHMGPRTANTIPTVILATAFLVLTVSLESPALLSLTSRRTNFPQGITMG